MKRMKNERRSARKACQWRFGTFPTTLCNRTMESETMPGSGEIEVRYKFSRTMVT